MGDTLADRNAREESESVDVAAMLAAFFAGASSSTLGQSVGDLDAALELIACELKRQWPGSTAHLLPFLTFLATRARPDELTSLHIGDLYVAFRAVEGDVEALQRIDAHLGHARAILLQRGHAKAVTDEVIQALHVELIIGGPSSAPRLTTYAGRGALLSWIVVGALRAAVRMGEREVRAGAREREHEAWSRHLELPADLERSLVRKEAREILAEALEQAVACLSPQERTLLRLHAVDGLSIDAIATIYGVHRATAARRIHRARLSLVAALRRSAAARSNLMLWEVDSLIRAAGSTFAPSIARMLQDDS